MSRPKPKSLKQKQEKKSFALGDEKAAKLSKSEQQQENKQKQIEQQKLEQETIRQIGISKQHHKSLEQFVSKEELQNIRIQQLFYLKGIKDTKKQIPESKIVQQKNAYYLMNDTTKVGPGQVLQKKKPIYGNYSAIINKSLKSQLKHVQGNEQLRRVGCMGVKLGMTTMWNKWGHTIPITVIQLDRVQVVQIKEPETGNELYQVQIGIGEPNYKKLTKSELGHFVKAQVPPKRILSEFKVSRECLLPIGYMMTPRHYTPGMFVDVISKSVGHGFQGTIKKDGFRRQPQTHGNSTTTRVLGSTGCRQDPGRVFKGKKMYGRMGNNIAVQTGLTVFKIDVAKNLLFLKGSVPGKAGTIVKIRDTLNLDKIYNNLELVHYPTFIQQEGVEYANQFSMYCGERDPQQIQVHDNAFILDQDDQEAAPTAAEKDAALDQ